MEEDKIFKIKYENLKLISDKYKIKVIFFFLVHGKNEFLYSILWETRGFFLKKVFFYSVFF